MFLLDNDEIYENYTRISPPIPKFTGLRVYVATTYICFNFIGFAINLWVLYVVAPLLFAPAIKVPKSILFYIFALCVGDLMTMVAMFLLIIDLVFGTWQFSDWVCKSYLIFDSMNKFMAPMIVFLISRTCYSTVCLDKKAGEKAATLKNAIVQFCVAVVFVLILLWPVFAYSQVYEFNMNPNNVTQEIIHMKKCGFFPSTQIQFWFNIIACFTSYAVPLFGIVYWYVSVPFFLKRRAVNALVTSSSTDAALKKVITTVLLLTVIYVVCWTPYWISMFTSHLLVMDKKHVIIISYIIHLLPYISCVAYPLIFTLLNRGIRSAHAKNKEDNRRRFRSMTDDASTQVRTAIRSIPGAKPISNQQKQKTEITYDASSNEKKINRQQTSPSNENGNSNLGFSTDPPPNYDEVMKNSSDLPTYDQAMRARSVSYIIDMQQSTSEQI
ncbi:unnamed protein product [Caenorhabditis angaria]|uniref:G-protein coupled receptors family 1 profile domain-containing protein n=1 Tax=Caenorhabditis angaria TaxID=860376 RepID=A0A9P1IMV7_9PELO|nr:unnamed protein product [Caenorhabditis angaria]